MATKKNKKTGKPSSTIALNKKAKFDFFIEDRLEAGISLEGWEVKSLREGKVQIAESYVFIKDGEAFISGMIVTPLATAAAYTQPEPSRIRKLLLHRSEIDKLIGAVDRKGYTLVALALYWKRGKVKMEIGTAKGKKDFDKRAVKKDRDWQREKARILKHG
jgi:SsrA-binding protein